MSLQGCPDCTDWDMFKDSCSDIDVLTDVITSWVAYCENNVIPANVFKVYDNSKPRVSKSLKSLMHKKKMAFKEGNPRVLHKVQNRD